MPGSDPCTQGTAILGAHEITGNWRNNNNQYTIKYSDVRFPPNQHEKGEPFYNHNHDISLVVLNEAAQMSAKVGTVCLPPPNSIYRGLNAVAAGWGRFAPDHVNRGQSPVLRKVTLKVSTKEYKHTYFLGTEVNKNAKGEWMDPCSGDSGWLCSYIFPIPGYWSSNKIYIRLSSL